MLAVGSMTVTGSAGGSAGSTTAAGSRRRTRASSALAVRHRSRAGGDRLLAAAEFDLRAVLLRGRGESLRELRRLADEVFGLRLGRERTGQFAAGLLHREVRLGHRERRVVHRSPAASPAGAELLPRRERGVHRVGEREHHVRPEPGHERVPVRLHDLAGEVLLRPGVGEVVHAERDVRHPQQPGAVVHRGGGGDLPPGDLHVERAGVRELQGGREVDRQRGVGRFDAADRVRRTGLFPAIAAGGSGMPPPSRDRRAGGRAAVRPEPRTVPA